MNLNYSERAICGSSIFCLLDDWEGTGCHKQDLGPPGHGSWIIVLICSAIIIEILGNRFRLIRVVEYRWKVARVLQL